MTYEQFKEKLNQNLQELMDKCDKWEVDLYEVIRYGDKIQKFLSQYRKLEWIKEKS